MNTSLRYLRRGSAEDTSSAWNLDRATGLRNIEHNRPQQQTRKKTTQNAIQLSQTGPLPCMLQLHLAYQSYKSLTKHSQSQGTFNLPQQGIDLPNPTVGGLPSLSWCKVNSKPKQHCRGVETQTAGDPRPALCWLGHHSYMPTKAKPSTPQPAERSGATPLTQIMRAQQRLLQTYLHRSHKLISNHKSLHLPKC